MFLWTETLSPTVCLHCEPLVQSAVSCHAVRLETNSVTSSSHAGEREYNYMNDRLNRLPLTPMERDFSGCYCSYLSPQRCVSISYNHQLATRHETWHYENCSAVQLHLSLQSKTACRQDPAIMLHCLIHEDNESDCSQLVAESCTQKLSPVFIDQLFRVGFIETTNWTFYNICWLITISARLILSQTWEVENIQ